MESVCPVLTARQGEGLSGIEAAAKEGPELQEIGQARGILMAART